MSTTKGRLRQKKTSEVYAEVAKFDLATEPILNLLHFASSNFRLEGETLPSWCPNFEKPQTTLRFGGMSAGYRAGFKDLTTFPFRVTTSLDCDAIHVQGFCVDQVAYVVPAAWLWIDDPTSAQSLIWEANCLELSQKVYECPDEVPEAHWRTIIAKTRGVPLTNAKDTI